MSRVVILLHHARDGTLMPALGVDGPWEGYGPTWALMWGLDCEPQAAGTGGSRGFRTREEVTEGRSVAWSPHGRGGGSGLSAGGLGGD